MTAYFRPYFEDHWATIRMLRSTPPGFVDDDPLRRQVFGTALQQAEELFGAAVAVGVASRPLPLFYALSQAGRAIAAAWAQDPWEIAGHGIKIRAEAGEPLRDTVITPTVNKRHDDAFSVVSRAVDSPGLSGATRLAAVWASLPELPSASRLMRWSARSRCRQRSDSPGRS